MNYHQKITDLLLKVGLTESEVLVYTELLCNPVETLYDLVGKTGLSKSSVYRAVESLKNLEMIKQKDGQTKAASLKVLISNIRNSSRKSSKIANQLQEISPFLSLPKESIDEFDIFYGKENIIEQYLEMAQRDYFANLDFGDFENFIKNTGGIEVGNKFRNYRVKHASNYAICTTFGPYSAYYSSKKAEKEFQSNVKLLNLDFKNKFIIFSDKGDHVLSINTDEEDMASATLTKSKLIADMQRAQFAAFSQIVGKN